MTAPQPQAAGEQVVDGLQANEIPAAVFASPEPLLLKGLVAAWPAVSHCRDSLESAYRYLARFWSGDPVTVYVGEDGIDGRFFYDENYTGFNFRAGTAPLNQVFQKLADAEGTSAIYVGSTPIDQWLPGFRSENDVRLPVDNGLASFWLGNRTRISAHFDFPDNVACVVAGRRRFTLFPPEQVENLYIGPIDRTPSGQAISVVDFAKPDFDRYPKFRQALEAAKVFELEPGDAIFIPSMWWHHVESLSDFNLLVNYWWCTSPQAMGSPMTALMHGILALRDLPPRQRAAWKRLFDHYVFEADAAVYEHIPEAGRGCLAPLDDAGARRLRAELLNKMNR